MPTLRGVAGCLIINLKYLPPEICLFVWSHRGQLLKSFEQYSKLPQWTGVFSCACRPGACPIFPLVPPLLHARHYPGASTEAHIQVKIFFPPLHRRHYPTLYSLLKKTHTGRDICTYHNPIFPAKYLYPAVPLVNSTNAPASAPVQTHPHPLDASTYVLLNLSTSVFGPLES